MNILFIYILYPHPSSPSSNMYSELVEEFRKQGHNCYVMACGENNETALINNTRGADLFIKTGKLFKVNYIQKGFNNLLLELRFKKAYKKYFADIYFDLIISSTPPITFTNAISYIKKKQDIPFYLILRDIFPQNAKDLGIINNYFIFNFFRRKEKKLYLVADYIGCMSKGNIDYLNKHNNLSENKFYILPNWRTPSQHKVDFDFKKYVRKDKFTLLFGGNLGKPQYITFILDAAYKLKEYADIDFLIIGDGNEKGKVVRHIKNKKLKNVRVFNKLPVADFITLAKKCDVGLVNLHPDFTIPNIPSRTLGYWEAGIPILAATDTHTDYPQLLVDTQSGLWSEATDLNQYVKNIKYLYDNEKYRIEMGKNGQKYFFRYATADYTYKTIMKQINKD